MTACQVLSNALIKEDLDVFFTIIISFLLELWYQCWLDSRRQPGYHDPQSLCLRRSGKLSVHYVANTGISSWTGQQGSHAWDRLSPWHSSHSVCHDSVELSKQDAVCSRAFGNGALSANLEGIKKTKRRRRKRKSPKWIPWKPQEGCRLSWFAFLSQTFRAPKTSSHHSRRKN